MHQYHQHPDPQREQCSCHSSWELFPYPVSFSSHQPSLSRQHSQCYQRIPLTDLLSRSKQQSLDLHIKQMHSQTWETMARNKHTWMIHIGKWSALANVPSWGHHMMVRGSTRDFSRDLQINSENKCHCISKETLPQCHNTSGTNLAVSDWRDVSSRDLTTVILGKPDLATVILGAANIPAAPSVHAPAAHPVSNLLLLVIIARCRVVEVASIIGISFISFLPTDRRAPWRIINKQFRECLTKTTNHLLIFLSKKSPGCHIIHNSSYCFSP